MLADRNMLNHGLIRFHVVADSDSPEDQEIKLKVRDAVIDGIQSDLRKVRDINEAREYLQVNLPRIRSLVDQTLRELGSGDESTVNLCEEYFDIRHYDTFSLPAGVYESLKIVIGEGLGKNWWCVSFPGLCLPATMNGFEDAAVGAGFSEPLVKTLSGNEAYEIRFFLLDQLGRLENFFHES